MAEQFTRNEQVVSSILTISSRNPVQFVSGFLLSAKPCAEAFFVVFLKKRSVIHAQR
jgi:hypothetical protein